VGAVLTIFAYSDPAMADSANIEYGTFTASGHVFYNAVEETMWVPPLPPVAAGQQMAVWWGLAGGATVIQPLMQYGAGSFGNAWVVLNEMADANGRQQGTTIPVQPGDQIDSAVEIDTNGGCSDYTNGTGCWWFCGYSINGGPWHWDHFLPNADVVFNTIFVGSLEVQTLPYQCNWLPNPELGSAINYGKAGTAFVIQGVWAPGPNWNQFQSLSSAGYFQTSPGLTYYPTNSGHCQNNWASQSSNQFILLWNQNASPGQWFPN
jgi:hypothetical protein